MQRWMYYSRLTFLDLVRLWPGVLPHIVIVAGICLPILILLGLKRGHVEEMRKELLTSPTGREVRFSSALQGDFLTPETLAELQNELPRVELIVPDTQRVVTLSCRGADGKTRRLDTVTLFSTVPGDPFLKQLGADVLDTNERAVVLGGDVAEDLAIGPGEEVELTVNRERQGRSESASTNFLVKAILPKGTQGDKKKIGYVDLRVVDHLEKYVMGYRVPEFGWPAQKASARDEYASYLIFCKSSDKMQKEDFRTWKERGYSLEEIKDPQVRTLYGLLDERSLGEVTVYRLQSLRFPDSPNRRLRLDPDDEIAGITTPTDDVVVPWNQPLVQELAKKPHLLIGCSLPGRTWLKRYLKHPESAFTGSDAMRVSFPYTSGPSGDIDVTEMRLVGQGSVASLKLKVAYRGASINRAVDLGSAVGVISGWYSIADAAAAVVRIGFADQVRIQYKGGVSDTGKSMPLAVVPANLLAHLDAFSHGTVDYDPLSTLFVPTPSEPTYLEGRLYGKSIDDIPAIVDELYKRSYSAKAQTARIREIHKQDASLQLLVIIVGFGVFAFGVITVISVLVDSTDRKRGIIGILRVMGVSRVGVFYLVFFRAALIGLLAGGLTVLFGYLITWVLVWEPGMGWLGALKPRVAAVIRLSDIAIVFAGSLLCCVIGSVVPALRASRLDPFDAIVEGRFR